jgi:hypothetical protein
MRYILDTYNLIHAASNMGGPLTGMTVRRLCQYLAASPAHLKATLVLDGRPKLNEPSENEFPDFTLVYSGTGVSADLVIGQIVERAASRKNMTVVSDDREVIRNACALYARVMGCESFMRQISQYNARAAADALPPKKTAGTPTTGEADHWMKEFGFEEGDGQGRVEEARPQRKADEELGGLNVEDLLGPRGNGDS